MRTKALVLAAEPQQNDPQGDRRKFLGGSDMAAVLGLSPWQTPYSLWLEKTAPDPLPPDPEKEQFFRHRKRLEPVIIELARDKYDLDIAYRNRRFIDKQLPFCSAELDFEWLDGPSGIQNADAKSVSPFAPQEWGEEGTDQIPDNYNVQFMFGLMVSQRQRTLCAALFGTDTMKLYRTERDEDYIQFIRDEAERFWELVVTSTPPPITTLSDVKLRWPKDNGTAIEATEEIAQMCRRLKLLRHVADGNEAEIELLTLDIEKYMGDSLTLLGSNGKKLATWKHSKRKGYTVEDSEFRTFRAA